MRPLCFSKFLLLLLSLSLGLFANVYEKSAIVYYGDDISYANVGIHDYIIVEAENVSPYTHGFKIYKDKIYAYVSVGEASSYRPYFKELKEEWKIAENSAWKSIVLDISNDEYHEFMYEKVIQPLVDKGHENFFFDTLDSYQLAVKGETDSEKYKLGLIRFIKKFKVRFPQSKVIINRGFEIIDSVHEDVEAVLFESLFYGLSSAKLAYTKITLEERQWLLNQVAKLKSYHLDVIAVDYVDITEKTKIQETIKKIQALGIIPYISNKELTRYGDSSKAAYKREILVLYNGLYGKEHSNAHLMAALPLEYLGYIPILKDLAGGLPDKEELSRYKCVVIWLEAAVKDTAAYENWIEDLVEVGKKVLFLDGFGVDNDENILDILRIEKTRNKAGMMDRQKLVYKDKMIGFENNPSLAYADYYYQPMVGERLLTFSNSLSQISVPVSKSFWGGYALSDYVTYNFNNNQLWVIDPFSFFKEVLELEDIPVPDTTTQNGRRLLFSHIDGDASMNRVESNPRIYSIGMVYEKILKKYAIPQSVSIVEAEISPIGIYPKDSPALEKIAQKIYELDHVEAATHTFTHPFYWGEIQDDDLDEKYRLKVNGYDFSLDREIVGSLDYINSRLMPEGKSMTNTVYWTGDCSPTEEVLEYVYKNNILNINGGLTVITNDKPWLALVSPLGIKRGEYHQIYTGAENENVYTNHFTGPFWGYKKVIQTFQLTDKPRRLKPIDIYYHFYAASKIASLTALEDVFEWALSQETMPIYTSEYIPKVMEFYDLSMFKTREGWHFKGMKELKTLRLDESLNSIDYKASSGVLGERREGTQRYVHLDTHVPLELHLKKDANKDVNYLVDTNAEVVNYKETNDDRTFSLKSYVDVVLNYHLQEGCNIQTIPRAISTVKKGNLVSLKFKGKEANVVIRCQ